MPASDDFSLSISISVAETDERVVTVALVGELDVTTTPQLGPHLEPTGDPIGIVVDVSGLDFIDSSGLNALVQAARALRERGVRFAVAGAAPHILRVIELVRLDDELDVVDTLEEALERVTASAVEERPN